MNAPTELKIIRIDPIGNNLRRPTEKTLSELDRILGASQPAAPAKELELLYSVALGDTGESRSCRYLLFLLVGAKDPTETHGEGLLEMRALDRKRHLEHI